MAESIVARIGMCLLALILGLTIALVDAHADGPPLPVLLLFLFGSALGFASPRTAVGTALILGVSIFALHVVGPHVGYRPPYTPSPTVFATLLALIPAVIGTLLGVWLRRGVFGSQP